MRRLTDWCYGSGHVRPADMYVQPRYVIETVARPVDDRAAFCHFGHGVNSYAVNYHLIYGHVAVFVQVAWGGAYVDNPTQAAVLARWFEQIEAIIALVQTAGVRPAGERVIVAQSEFGSPADVFGVLERPLGDHELAKEWIYDHVISSPALEAGLSWLERTR